MEEIGFWKIMAASVQREGFVMEIWNKSMGIF